MTDENLSLFKPDGLLLLNRGNLLNIEPWIGFDGGRPDMIFLLLIGGPIVQDVLVLFQDCTEFMTHAAFYNASNVPLSNVLILRS